MSGNPFVYSMDIKQAEFLMNIL